MNMSDDSEKSAKKFRSTSRRASSKPKTTRKSARKSHDDDENQRLWFEPDYILGASDRFNDQIMFRIKVKDSDENEIVPAKVANVVCPHLVIKFYEDHLVFGI